MNELKFKEKFERTENPEQLGENKNAIDKIIKTCKKMEMSNDLSIKEFATNFSDIDSAYPHLMIFSDDQSGFRLVFSALQISDNADDLTIAHEIGHMLNGIKNTKYDEKTHFPTIAIPEHFEEIAKAAKKNCIIDTNKENFKSYIQHLCNDSDISDAEKGPVSDIMSAVFRTAGLRIGNKDNICMFPSRHAVFYEKDINEEKRTSIIYDEIFANIYALKATNCEKELGILKQFLGDEFISFYDKEMHKCIDVFKEKRTEKTNQNKVELLGKEVKNLSHTDLDIVSKQLNYEKEEYKER